MVEAQVRPVAIAGDQLDLMNHFFGVRAIEQEWIVKDGFMCEASAAGFFPGEVLIEKIDLEAGGGKPLGAQSSGRSSAHDRYPPRGHRFSSLRSRAGVGMDGWGHRQALLRRDQPGAIGLASNPSYKQSS